MIEKRRKRSTYLLQQIFFLIKNRYSAQVMSSIRRFWLSMGGMKVGTGTVIKKLFVSWPHQVHIGNNCILEHNLFFKFDGIWQQGPSIIIGNNVFLGANCEFNIRKRITIGNDSLIASGCKFVDHDHGMSTNALMRVQHGIEAAISIGSNVWLGCNVVVLKGVQIGNGAIVAAGAVVTKSILPNEIWAGIPAKKIGERT